MFMAILVNIWIAAGVISSASLFKQILCFCIAGVYAWLTIMLVKTQWSVR